MRIEVSYREFARCAAGTAPPGSSSLDELRWIASRSRHHR